MGEKAIAASRLSDHYATAASAVAAEESLERKYRLEPGPDVLRRYNNAASELTSALSLAARAGTPQDRVIAERILEEHGPYLDAIRRMFAAVDRGDAAEVLRIDGGEVDPKFDAIEQAVDREASKHHEEALRDLEEMRARETYIADATPFVFLAGLLMVGLFSGVCVVSVRNSIDSAW